jgi:beta-lactam-binding protein with PASTA domain
MMCFRLRSFIALVLLTIIFLCSCNTDSDSSLPNASESNIAIAIPAARSLIKLPEEGTWYAFINISGARNLTCDVQVDANTCELSVDTAAEQVSGRIDLAAGTYSLQVVLEYRDPTFINASRADGRWSIADAQKQVTVVAGQTSSLTYNEDDYNLPDTDGDRASNLVELGNRTDPGDQNDPAKTIAVPGVVGLNETEARSQIESVGLVVGLVTREFSDSVEANRVISQNPMGGDMVGLGTSVNFVVSNGVGVTVPDCQNVLEADCRSLIENAGLKVGNITQEFSDTITKGNVIRTVPAATTTVDKGSAVNLVISKGQDLNPVQVPNVVGQSETQARSQIEGAGLTVGSVTHEFSESVDANLVISQNPSGGVLVSLGAKVDLVVSNGVGVTVPDCQNVLEADCRSLIENAGLKVGNVTQESSDSIPEGNVIRTDPAQDTMVSKGSSINLVVSLGPPVPVPDCRSVPRADCEASITNAGLKVGAITQAASDTIPAGNVIRTDPAQDTMVSKGSSVDLVVSLGPPG